MVLQRPRSLCGELVRWQMTQEPSESHSSPVCLPPDEAEWFTSALRLSASVNWVHCRVVNANLLGVVKDWKRLRFYHQLCVACCGVRLSFALSLRACFLKFLNTSNCRSSLTPFKGLHLKAQSGFWHQDQHGRAGASYRTHLSCWLSFGLYRSCLVWPKHKCFHEVNSHLDPENRCGHLRELSVWGPL